MDEVKTLQQTSKTPPAGTAPWIIILLLLVFPPLAWYFMWRESKFHRWFPLLILMYGILYLSLSGIMALYIYPQVQELYKSLEIKFTSSWIIYLSYLFIFLSILQICYAIYLYRKIMTNPVLSKKLLSSTITILAIIFLFGPIFAGFTELAIITPIYKITSSFTDDNTTNYKGSTNEITGTPNQTVKENSVALTSPDGKKSALFYNDSSDLGEGSPIFSKVDITDILSRKVITYAITPDSPLSIGHDLYWSPVNDKIYFTNSTNGIGRYALWLSDIDGGNAKLLSGKKSSDSYSDNLKTAAIWGAEAINFSRDGKMIVTARADSNLGLPSPLWLMSYDGTNQRPIPITGNFTNVISRISFDSDNESINFSTWNGNKEQHYRVKLSGGTPQLID